MNGKELAAYCGLYCGACAIKNGQIANAAKSLRRLLQAYGYAGWAPTMAEFIPATKGWPQFEGVMEWLTTQDCQGCPAGGGNPQCATRLCVRENNLAGCWDCADIVGCQKRQHEIGSANADAIANCQRIREAGLEKWLAEQAAKVAAGFSYADILAAKE